jgi:hypothetical protein
MFGGFRLLAGTVGVEDRSGTVIRSGFRFVNVKRRSGIRKHV